MTRKATSKPPTSVPGGEGELRHYTPEEVYEKGWLPFKPRTLRDKAQRHEIPHSRAGRKITFRLCHIREIAEAHDVRPISEAKPARTAKTPAAA